MSHGVWLWAFLVKLLSGEGHQTPLMKNEHHLRWWLGAIRQQAITWANDDPDLCCHMVTQPQWVNNQMKITFLSTISLVQLMYWGWMTHIWVSKLTIIDSHNGLSPGRHQAIIWTNDGISLIGPSGTNFSEKLIKILIFLFKKMHLKVSSGKWRPFCLRLNVLINVVPCWRACPYLL